MNPINFIKSTLLHLYLSIKRFPLAIAFSTTTTIILVMLVNNSYNEGMSDILTRIAMTSAFGFPLFLCINLIFKINQDTKKIIKYSARFTGAAFLILYYFFYLQELNMVSITRYIAFNLALYLVFLVIPYFYKRKNFELYVVEIFSRFLVTVIYAVVLYLGLSLILFTLNQLLNIPVSPELYISTWLVVAGIFAPIFLLGGIPHHNRKFNLNDYPVIFEILLLYIVMPLIAIYTAILYIYFIKILVTTQWPQGLVAHLVLWYSAISISVIFFISPLINKNRWIKYFITWFPRAIIPLLVMMFVAIGIRINEYGITENRYFVVLLGLWAFGIMLYYIFSRKKRNIILPLSLAIITVLAVIGPWSSFSISKYSQNKRFENILSRYGMIKEERIVRTEQAISLEDQKEINSIIRYFLVNHKLDDLEYLPEDFTTDDMEEIFGFSYKLNNFREYRHFSYDLYNYQKPLAVVNYDYLFHLTNSHNQIEEPTSRLTVKYNKQNNTLTITQDEKEIYTVQLLNKILQIHKNIRTKDDKKIMTRDYTFSAENKRLKLKFIFNSVNGYVHRTIPDKIKIDNLDFYLLVKIK